VTQKTYLETAEFFLGMQNEQGVVTCGKSSWNMKKMQKNEGKCRGKEKEKVMA
jgi:hypothetical protein